MSVKLDSRWCKRGSRKCPKCGTSNGNRAAVCKNKQCSVTLSSESSGSKPVGSGTGSPVAVQLLYPQADTKIYSVKRHIKGGNGERSFVQIHDNVESAEGDLLLRTAVCYADVRQHTDAEGTCRHVRAANKCERVAEQLPLNKCVVHALKVSEGEKAAIWRYQMEDENDGCPAVQMVTASTFVARTQNAEVHQIGFCHVTAGSEGKFRCDCQEGAEETTDGCLHVYAVVAGILGSEKLRPHWESLLTRLYDPEIDSGLSLSGDPFPLIGGDQRCFSQKLIGDFADAHARESDEFYSLQLMDCQIELMDELNLTDRIDFCPSDIEMSEDNLVLDYETRDLHAAVIEESVVCPPAKRTANREKLVEVTTKKSALRQSSRVAKEKLTKGSYNVRKLMKILESNGVVFNRLKRSEALAVAATGPRSLDTVSIPSYDATLCNLTFTRWLDSVIEQLNAVIDYNDSGQPVPQVFRIHQNFFQCLRARFSIGHRHRMPDHVCEPDDVRLPRDLRCEVYKFSHYKSLKHVLRTDTQKLAFVKSFMRHAGDRFTAIDRSEDDDGPTTALCGGRPIQPVEYKTYIKMGSYRHEPTPGKVFYFVVKWVAGVLPRCGFGDLRIEFEFGHSKNNQHVGPPER